jgi:hypothetical protein
VLVQTVVKEVLYAILREFVCRFRFIGGKTVKIIVQYLIPYREDALVLFSFCRMVNLR